MIFSSPPQFGQCSSSKPRLSSLAQARALELERHLISIGQRAVELCRRTGRRQVRLPHAQHEGQAAKLQAARVPVTLRMYERASHMTLGAVVA